MILYRRRSQGLVSLSLVAGMLAFASPGGAQDASPADMVFTNGAVYTADAAQPLAQAVAIRGGKIVFVGSTREARTLIGDDTRVVDLEGKTMIPGMIDSHGHLAGLGSALRIIDLVGTRSYEEVIERVVARVADVPAGQWIQGRGWDQNEWGDTRFPHHAALSAAVPDHPVILTRVDGHAIFVNAAAMEMAGIDASTADPSGGRVVRTEDGDALGVFVDRAMGLVRRVVPRESREEVHGGSSWHSRSSTGSASRACTTRASAVPPSICTRTWPLAASGPCGTT